MEEEQENTKPHRQVKAEPETMKYGEQKRKNKDLARFSMRRTGNQMISVWQEKQHLMTRARQKTG